MKAVLLLVAGLALLARPADAHCNYLIEKGDTLTDIAKDNGYNESAVIALNPQVADPELIFEGSTLRLPCPGGDDTNANSIFELLEHRSDMFTLFTALASVGMLEDLKDGDMEATLFAPTDAAFAKLLASLNLTAGQLLNETELVTDVLAYHVVPGEALDSGDFPQGTTTSYKTLLQGKRLRVRKNNNGVNVRTVAGQRVPVKVADLQAGDAVVHVIDEVLLPLEADAPTAAPAAARPTTAPATAKPNPAVQGCTYTVVAGDTLFDIAAKSNTSLEAVVALNPEIENPDLIQIGAKVKVC